MENPDFEQLPFRPHYHEPIYELPDNLSNVILPASNKAIVITLGEGVKKNQDSCWDTPGAEIKEVEI